MVRAIEKALDQQIERRTLDGFDYKVPAPKRSAQPARPAKAVTAGKSTGKLTVTRKGSEAGSGKSTQRRRPSRLRRPQANRSTVAATASH